jgi:hypothetical protein
MKHKYKGEYMKRFLLSITTCFSIIFAHPQLIEAQTQEQDGRTKRNVPDGYVDLGLPSGTLWKDQNEVGFYTYDQAVPMFGSSLPTKEQWEELIDACRWTWNGKGYKVEGPNGGSIVLPVAGFRYCDGSVHCVALNADYWSSTPYSSAVGAWLLHSHASKVEMNWASRCCGHSVRLVR